jgi:hypothetical protein
MNRLNMKFLVFSMDLQAYYYITNNTDMVTYLVEDGAGITDMAATHCIRPSSSHHLIFVSRFTNAIPVTTIQFNYSKKKRRCDEFNATGYVSPTDGISRVISSATRLDGQL